MMLIGYDGLVSYIGLCYLGFVMIAFALLVVILFCVYCLFRFVC